MQLKLSNFSLFCVLFGVIVVALGAYTRLKDAGLGCPDWPGCYGSWRAPIVTDTNHNTTTLTIDSAKAWIEMIHRYAAGSLGLLIFALCIITFNKTKATSLRSLTITAAILVIIQAVFGMWTVTLKLYPIVVSTHLFLGMSLIVILWSYFLRLRYFQLQQQVNFKAKIITRFTTIALIVQILLGAWTSSNYAALVCSDFPTCQGQWLPELDWAKAFALLQVGIFDSPGVALENTARVTIQFAHRLGALITSSLLLLSCIMLYKYKGPIRKTIYIALILLGFQLLLGITNIFHGLPLWAALTHNICALILLLTVISLNFFSHGHTFSDYH